jgi:hypothetical protein
MANNTWKNYTHKSTALSDNDEVMLLDSTDEKNKRGLMSKFWDYVVDKMSTAVISKLETNNKTIIGAINALNNDNSINLLSVKEQDTFSNRLKERNYKMTVGYFYGPSDNPFSFNAGFYIAFNSIYLMEATQFLIIGFNTNGIMESKFVNFK